MSPRPRILLVSDLAYQAQGRRYCDEDIYLASQLRRTFDVAICHPRDAVALMDDFDVVLVRNSGPVLTYPEDYQRFRDHARASGAAVFNQLTGKADMEGKQYLPDLWRAGYPVIPTIERIADATSLPDAARYVIKPKFGADSMGMHILPSLPDDLGPDMLLQPHIDFTYEISFYFVGHTFIYALHAPDATARWRLAPYQPSEADLAFAQRFIEWNDITHGIQRVDACRTRDGGLLLVELEDLNPYLSLDSLDDETRARFVDHLIDALSMLATDAGA